MPMSGICIQEEVTRELTLGQLTPPMKRCAWRLLSTPALPCISDRHALTLDDPVLSPPARMSVENCVFYLKEVRGLLDEAKRLASAALTLRREQPSRR